MKPKNSIVTYHDKHSFTDVSVISDKMTKIDTISCISAISALSLEKEIFHDFTVQRNDI